MNIDNIMKSLSTQQNNHIAIIGLDCTLSNYEGQEEVLSLIRYNRNGIRTIPYNRKKYMIFLLSDNLRVIIYH